MIRWSQLLTRQIELSTFIIGVSGRGLNRTSASLIEILCGLHAVWGPGPQTPVATPLYVRKPFIRSIRNFDKETYKHWLIFGGLDNFQWHDLIMQPKLINYQLHSRILEYLQRRFKFQNIEIPYYYFSNSNRSWSLARVSERWLAAKVVAGGC